MTRFARYVWLTLAFNVLVVLWGAIVRATGSGAGCGSHWPLCNGVVLPQSPRIETVIEFSHRLTSGIALLLVVGLVVGAFRLLPRGHAGRKAAVWSMFFMVGEAAVGAALVLFRLVADNPSMARAMFMATHLVNTFLLLAALTLTAHFVSGGPAFRLRGRGWWSGGFALGLLGLLVSGVSGATAALGDTLFPSQTLVEALRQDLSPTAHLLIRLRIFHPAIAIASGLLALTLALRLLKRRLDPETRRFAGWTAGLVFTQILMGTVNVLLLAPVWLQVVHLLMADLLWIAFVLLGASALAYLGLPRLPSPAAKAFAPAADSPEARVSAPSRVSSFSPSSSGNPSPS
ncbi:MAG: COX15/CtaA family protein [Thermoanaerobaculia bacterium]